jgi:B-cell receptor-associated protein 31
MTIYYTLTFFLMVAEVVTFGVLVAPLPHKIRKGLFNWLSTSAIVAKVAYGLKISFIFIGILFVDALQRMQRTAAEADIAKSGGQGLQDARTETNHAAKKFYAQRNVYLTGFTLFLSLVLTRVFAIILDLIETQAAYATLKQQLANNNRPGNDALTKEVEDLKKKLASKTQDFGTSSYILHSTRSFVDSYEQIP